MKNNLLFVALLIVSNAVNALDMYNTGSTTMTINNDNTISTIERYNGDSHYNVRDIQNDMELISSNLLITPVGIKSWIINDKIFTSVEFCRLNQLDLNGELEKYISLNCSTRIYDVKIFDNGNLLVITGINNYILDSDFNIIHTIEWDSIFNSDQVKTAFITQDNNIILISDYGKVKKINSQTFNIEWVTDLKFIYGNATYIACEYVKCAVIDDNDQVFIITYEQYGSAIYNVIKLDEGGIPSIHLDNQNSYTTIRRDLELGIDGNIYTFNSTFSYHNISKIDDNSYNFIDGGSCGSGFMCSPSPYNTAIIVNNEQYFVTLNRLCFSGTNDCFERLLATPKDIISKSSFEMGF